LSHPLLVSGIARDEIELARRFLALTVVGHEIGHLRSGTSGHLQHLFPTRKANGLRCHQRNSARQTEEERADAYGIADACDAIRAIPGRTQRRDASAAIETMSAMRNTLDEDLFAFDDSCAGDDTYPSMSRRKSTFAYTYARCLYPDTDLPYDGMATDLDRAFSRLENWLRSRQITGFAASPEYGASPLFRFDVVETTSVRLFAIFDSSGSSSRVSIASRDDDQVRHDVLAAWDRAGNLITSLYDTATVAFLARFSAIGGTIARYIAVHCSSGDLPCSATVSEKAIPPGFDLWPLHGGAVATTSGRHIQSYASPTDYIAGQSVLTAEAEFDLDEDGALIAGNANLIIVGRRPGANETESGVHLVGIAGPSQSRWVTVSTVGTTMSPLRAVGLYETQAAFVFQSRSVASDQRPELILCPLAALQSSTTSQLDCDLYRSPDDLSYAIGLANNDLQTLGTSIVTFKYCPNLAVRQAGWLWLVDPAKQLADALPGNGMTSCRADRGSALVYRARRIDEVKLSLVKSAPRRITIAIAGTRPGR